MTRSEYASRPGRSSKWITKSRRLAIYLRDGFRCAYCGKDLRHGGPLTICLDHLKPREHGGGNDSQNLVTACFSCNSARQSRCWYRFATEVAARRINTLRRRVPNLDLARAIIAGTTPLAEVLS